MPHRTRPPGKVYLCAWCGEKKPIAEMRHPASSRGKAPSTCHTCRESNPALSWCDFHGEPHAVGKFVAYEPPRRGYWNICRDAYSHKRSIRKGDDAGLRCPACGEQRHTWEFRGNRSKVATCRICEGHHPGKRWCVDCLTWLPESAFCRTGAAGKFLTVRCNPCRAAHSHGTTVAKILEVQGSLRPECAACGATQGLSVDHDHNCCPAAKSSGCCVRGYLCHACNTAEGLLKTPERAMALAAYMQRIAREEGTPNVAAIA